MGAFNLVDIDKAIYSALTTGLISNVQGVYKFRAVEGIKAKLGVKPYVVYSHFLVEKNNTFTTDGMELIYNIEIYDHYKNGDIPMMTVFDLIMGNANPAESTLATIGLHRRKLTLTSNNHLSVIGFERAGGLIADDPDVIGYFLHFKMYFSRNPFEVDEPE